MAKLNAVDIIGMEEIRNFDQAGVAVKPLAGFKVDVCANWPPREGQNEPQEVAIADCKYVVPPSVTCEKLFRTSHPALRVVRVFTCGLPNTWKLKL